MDKIDHSIEKPVMNAIAHIPNALIYFQQMAEVSRYHAVEALNRQNTPVASKHAVLAEHFQEFSEQLEKLSTNR